MEKEPILTEEELKQKEELEAKRKSKKKTVSKHEQKKEKHEEELIADEIEYKKEEGFKIFRISIWRVLAYFVIYSIVGYLLETLFGLATKGVLESRKSFLYGPFCTIYGLGGLVMVISLQYFRKNNVTLFIGGFIVGSVIEYLVSLVGELVFHIKWWDYSDMPFNINGRICFAYSLFWGILAIMLITSVNKKVDKFLDWVKTKISVKMFNGAVSALIIIMILDCAITGVALKLFLSRLVTNHELTLQNATEYVQSGQEMYKIEFVKTVADKFFSDEKMLKTFPNLRVTGEDGKMIYIDSILKHIQPYYVKVFEVEKMHKEYEKVQKVIEDDIDIVKNEIDKVETVIQEELTT